MSKHTELPWEATQTYETFQKGDHYCYEIEISGQQGRLVCKMRGENARANARFIVTACNSHDQLLEACKEARAFCAADACLTVSEILSILDTAISLAEGKEKGK